MFEGIPGPDEAEFDGETYEPQADGSRLFRQLQRVCDAMTDGEWRTLAEIEAITGDPQSSISARLRDLRKERFGAYKVEKRRRGAIAGGVWETRLGKKGAGDPVRRKGGQVPQPFVSLAHIADSLLRHLEHRKTCSIFKVLEGRPCDCGLGPGPQRIPRDEKADIALRGTTALT